MLELGCSFCLVVQKELGQQAEVLGVDLVLAPVNLEHGDGTFPVDLVAGRVLQQELLI